MAWCSGLIPAGERQSLVYKVSGQPELQNRDPIQMRIQEKGFITDLRERCSGRVHTGFVHEWGRRERSKRRERQAGPGKSHRLRDCGKCTARMARLFRSPKLGEGTQPVGWRGKIGGSAGKCQEEEAQVLRLTWVSLRFGKTNQEIKK